MWGIITIFLSAGALAFGRKSFHILKGTDKQDQIKKEDDKK